MVARSRRILKFIQKVDKSKSQKVSLFAKSCTFRLFGQFSHFSTFRAKIQKVALFAKSCTFLTFRASFSLFDFSGKNSKSRTFRKKLHFSTFRAIFSLFDFSGKNSKSRTFRKKLHFLTFRSIFSLFDFSGKNSESRTFREKLHFSTFRSVFSLFDFSGKKCKKLHFSISIYPLPARNIGYGICQYVPYTSVSIYRRYRMWDIAPRQYLSIPLSSPKYRIRICLLRVSIYLSAPSAADMRYGILPKGRRCRIGYGM